MCLGRPPELIEWLTFPIPITNFRGNFCFSNIFFVFSISFTSGLKPPPREKPSFAFCLEAVMFRMTIMHVHVLLYCHIWRTTWSIPLTIPNTVPCWWHFSLVFLQGKETPLKLEERLGYMQAAFLKLDFGRWVFPASWLTRVLSEVRCF